MFGSTVMDVGIGLIFVFLTYGLVCTALNEIICQAISLRAETLWGTIRSILHDPKGTRLAKDLYNQSMIRTLAVKNADRTPKEGETAGDDPNERGKPSYLPAHLFSLALVELIKEKGAKAVVAGGEASTAKPAETGTPDLLDLLDKADIASDVKATLQPLIRSAAGDVDQARKNIETWYDAAMERASGWYKQRVQYIILGIACFIVLASNGDAIMIVNRLWSSPALRAQAVASATTYQPDVKVETASIQGLIGWSGPFSSHDPRYDPTDPRRFPAGLDWILKSAGLLFTALAASLGAPFWFDMLNKIMNVRAAGKSPEEKPRSPDTVPQPRARIETKTGTG